MPKACPATILPALLALPTLVPVAVADTQVPPERRVIVTATRTPTPLDEVLAPVLLIDRAEIDRSLALDPSELLRFRAGIDLSRNGGPGQTTGLFIRGAESNHTLVLLDGVRINPGTIGIAQIQNLSPQLLERIEVVKGPRSALYGTDAIGGVVNVITRRGRDDWSAEAGVGAHDTTSASLVGGFGDQALGLDFGVSWLDSDGFPTRTDSDVDRGYDDLGVTARLSGRVGAGELALKHFNASGTTEYVDFLLTPVDQDYRNATTALEYVGALGEAATLRLAASRLDDRIEQNQSPDYLRTERDTFDLQVDFAARGVHQPSVGASFADEDASSESYGSVLSARTESWNAFVQDRISAGRHDALLALGYTDHETAGNATTWNLEYGYALTSAVQVYASTGTGFRAPDATDRFGFGGNPDLDPERSSQYEAGVRWRPDSRHRVEAAVFRSDIEDLIEFEILSFDPFVGENRNVARARVDGLELAYGYTGEDWQARVEATLQDPEDRSTGQTLLRRAKESLSASLVRGFGPLQLGLDLLATGERLDFGFPAPVELDAYLLANLTAAWRIGDHWTVSGRVENLLDEDYELADGYETAGRGLYLSLRYTP
jgi:vitamin B12 transporter